MGIGLVVAGVAVLSKLDQPTLNYGARILGNAALGVVVTLLYARSWGELTVRYVETSVSRLVLLL